MNLGGFTQYLSPTGSCYMGIGVTFDNAIWGIAAGGSKAARLAPSRTSWIETPSIFVSPYTYSDFIGYGLNVFANPRGHHQFTVTGDVSCPRNRWTNVTWNATRPVGTTVNIYVRVANTAAGLSAQPWIGPFASSPANLAAAPGPVPTGPYIEIDVRMETADRRVTPRVTNVNATGVCDPLTFGAGGTYTRVYDSLTTEDAVPATRICDPMLERPRWNAFTFDLQDNVSIGVDAGGVARRRPSTFVEFQFRQANSRAGLAAAPMVSFQSTSIPDVGVGISRTYPNVSRTLPSRRLGGYGTVHGSARRPAQHSHPRGGDGRPTQLLDELLLRAIRLMPHRVRSSTRPRWSTQVGAFGLVVLSGLSGVSIVASTVIAQPTPSAAYARVAQETHEQVAEAPPLSSEERVRRAQVVARAGEATLTVGEIENYLAHSPLSEGAQFQTPEGQARIVRELLRVHLLARAAVARGAVSDATRFSAQRAEDMALVRIYTEDLRRRTALRLRSEPVQAAPVQHTNEQRYGVVFRGSRANAQRWIHEVASLPADAAFRLAEELGEGVETPWAERDATPLDPVERDALWGLAEPSDVSAPISIGQGRFAVVLLGSIQGAMEIGVGAEAQVYLESEEAVNAEVEVLRTAHVTNYDSARVDGVAFRLPRELSRESMEAIAVELEQTAAEVAQAQAAEGAHAVEAPHPIDVPPAAEEPH